ncbi:hypothetical protein ACFVZJ_24535 [Streptomyces sp. NPDC058322]|uniref:hypothetical protein n=1 Tax=unclassified Streptomyces TaxID=2593676 RepID=UPI00340ABCFE|nr:hypothetical protein OG355_26915 [Streptomyces sp. NBC_00987]
MERRPAARSGFNWWLPSVYAAAVVLTGALGSGRATGIVAAVGGVLLGLYYGFGSRLRARD